MPGALEFLDPKVERYILAEDGEEILDEVTRHWMASLWPGIRLAVGLWFFASAWMFSSALFWILIVLSVGVSAQALWRMAEEYRDRFVVTSEKVYRVHGNLDQKRASMPLTRILDITVDRPFAGRIFGYGHFVFESAAQDQGLREIRWVPDVDGRERLIQRVIRAAGLGTRVRSAAERDDDGT